MLEIWEQVFHQTVTPETDFFVDLGGDSMRATQLVGQIAMEFGVSMSEADLFDSPTPAGMAAVVAELCAGEQDDTRRQ
jgi:acyl carrier protein